MFYMAGILSFILTFLLMPFFIKLAIRLDFVDRPDERKIHEKPIPHIGGWVIFIVFFLVIMMTYREFNASLFKLFMASALILAIGIYDDWHKTKGMELSFKPKLLIQLLAASIVFWSGTAFTGFSNPFNDTIIVLPWFLQYVLTVLWIFGITTVINFTDGIDGLAAGVSSIASVTLFIVALLMGHTLPALMAVVLVGALIGYLQYNKHPAQIFMGDAGATFVGFMIAVISLQGVYKQATLLSIFIPVLALGVPIFDNIYVVIKRYLNGHPVYQADRTQLHFRLLDKGLNVKQVNHFICLVTLCLCLVAINILLVGFIQ